MERELSVAVLGDTKLFKKSYKSRICSIIEEYGELELDLSALDKKEKEKVILEESLFQSCFQSIKVREKKEN